jgi:hypothetical protein
MTWEFMEINKYFGKAWGKITKKSFKPTQQFEELMRTPGINAIYGMHPGYSYKIS